MKIKQLISLFLSLIGTFSLLGVQDDPKLPSETQRTKETKESNVSDEKYEKYPVCKVYNLQDYTSLDEIWGNIDSMTSLGLFYDKNTYRFSTKQNLKHNVSYNMLVWDGFINIKKEGIYTFLVTWKPQMEYSYSRIASWLSVNSNWVARQVGGVDHLQFYMSVALKPGFNDIRFVIYANRNLFSAYPEVLFRPKNAVCNYKELTPSVLFHKVEGDDW